MRLRDVVRIALITGILLAGRASAGVVILQPGDPRGGEVRAAASEFWLPLIKGDTATAKKHFAPASPAQAGLLETYGQMFAATNEMAAWLEHRATTNPATTTKPVPGAMQERARSSVIDGPIVLAEGQAWLAASGIVLDGTRLERTNGQWSVTRLASNSARARGLDEYAAAMTKVLRRGLAAPEDKRDAVMSDPSLWRDPAMEAAMEHSMTTPDGDPEVPAAAATPLPAGSLLASAADMAGLIGSDIESEKFKQFVASLPGLPRFSTVNARAWLVSDEAGVRLNFSAGRTWTLRGVACVTEQYRGSHAYRGSLPYGLSMSDHRADVERKLGPPPTSMGGSTTEYTAQYQDLGLWIDYAGRNSKDPRSPVAVISLNKAIAAATATMPTTQSVHVRSPRIAFRLVLDNAAPGDANAETLAGTDGNPLAVARQVLMDESSIDRVAPMIDPNTGERKAGLTMTAEGAKRLEKITRENTGRRLAIVLDGHVLIAPMIHGVVSKNVEISFGRDGGAETFGPKDMLGRLHAAMNALPATTQPASTRP